MPNVIITPHNAFNTQEALQRILNTDLENIRSFLEKNNPAHPVL
jgi:D-lactate dehydrogenase